MRSLILLLALTLTALPLCQRQPTAHSCCPSHSGHCAACVDQSPNPVPVRAAVLSAPILDRFTLSAPTTTPAHPLHPIISPEPLNPRSSPLRI